MEETLTQLLLAADTVVSLVGRRVTPGLRDQGAPLPGLVITVVDDADDVAHDGPTGLSDARVQIDAYGATSDSAKAVSRAVRDLLNGYASEAEGENHGLVILPISAREVPPDGTEADPTYRVTMDFNVWASKPD
jgi:hypothetical protein